MKLWTIPLALLAITLDVFAANPAFQSFDTNDFIITPSLSHPQIIHTARTNSGGTNVFINTTIINTNTTIINTNTTIINNATTNIFNSTTNIIDNSVTIITNSTLIVTNTTIIGLTNQLWEVDGFLDMHPIVEQQTMTVTNLISERALYSDGAFITRASSTFYLLPGINSLILYTNAYVTLLSTDPSAVIQLNSSPGNGSHIWLVNFWTNIPFSLPSGPLGDIPTRSVWIRGGNWNPTEVGETLELLGVPNGYVEVGRSNPNGPAPALGTNYWTNILGVLQPIDLTLPVEIDSQLRFGPGATNIVYRDGNDLVYTNTGTDVKFAVSNGSSKAIALEAQSGSAVGLTTAGSPSSLFFRNGADQFSMASGKVAPTTDLGLNLGDPTGPRWLDGAFAGTLYISGYLGSPVTSYSRLAISHTGTNGVILLSSQSAGNAGVARPFEIDRNLGVPLVVGDTQHVDAFVPSVTNAISSTITFIDATNGMDLVDLTQKRYVFNGSGSDQTINFAADWHNTSGASVVCTNGKALKIYFDIAGLTDTSARQSNVWTSVTFAP